MTQSKPQSRPASQTGGSDDNLDDMGRDLRTGETSEEQHPQQELEVGKRKSDDRP